MQELLTFKVVICHPSRILLATVHLEGPLGSTAIPLTAVPNESLIFKTEAHGDSSIAPLYSGFLCGLRFSPDRLDKRSGLKFDMNLSACNGTV